jgi:hypothetical protein
MIPFGTLEITALDRLGRRWQGLSPPPPRNASLIRPGGSLAESLWGAYHTSHQTILALELCDPLVPPRCLDGSNYLLDADRGNTILHRFRRQRKQKRHQTAPAIRAVATEDWAALIAEENKRAAQLQSKDDLTEELIVASQDARHILADRPCKEAVLFEQFPIPAPYVVQVAEREIASWVAAVAITSLKDRTSAEFPLDQLLL